MKQLATWGEVGEDFAAQLTDFQNTFLESVKSLGSTREALAQELKQQEQEARATLKKLDRENIEIRKYSLGLGLRIEETLKEVRGLPKGQKIKKDAVLSALNGNLEALEHIEILAQRGDTIALKILALTKDLEAFAKAFTAHQFAACVYLARLEESTPYAPADYAPAQDFTHRLGRDPKTFANAPNTHALARVPVCAKTRRRLTKTN